ncbi:MAG: SipW-dependent-type signal peptide-containing protein [Lachnospiraceae bacterium]|nr:SipW-dependent-type signal peptide-containing protein [Lachnospiraceae bacterium]
MKKKIIVICAVVALALAAIVGGTLAYFTDTKEATNTFTVGNVKITLDEAAVKYDSETHKWATDSTADRVTAINFGKEGEAGIYPGAVLPKDPTVHNKGKNDAWIRVKVTLTNYSAFKDAAEKHNITDLSTIFGGHDENSWKLAGTPVVDSAVDTVTYSYLYKEVVPAGEDAAPIFTSVTIPSAFDEEDMAAIAGEDGAFNLHITADAIQAEGFTTPAEAFEAFDAQ